jgi:hypothetical protein
MGIEHMQPLSGQEFILQLQDGRQGAASARRTSMESVLFTGAGPYPESVIAQAKD